MISINRIIFVAKALASPTGDKRAVLLSVAISRYPEMSVQAIAHPHSIASPTVNPQPSILLVPIKIAASSYK